MTDATIQQITGEVDDLTRKVNDLSNLMALFMVNGLQDAFDGSGNQTFGGGIARLSKTGLNFVQASVTRLIFWSGTAKATADIASQDLAYIAGYMDEGSDGSLIFGVSMNGLGGARSLLEQTAGGTAASLNTRGMLRLDCAESTDTLSSATIAANTNDLDIGFTAVRLELNVTGASDLTGIVSNNYAGRVVLLFNVGTATLTLKDASVSSTLGNRFDTGGDVVINAKGGAMLVCRLNGAAYNWHVVAVYGS